MNDNELITSESINSILSSNVSTGQPYIINAGITANRFTTIGTVSNSSSTSNSIWPVMSKRQEWIDAFPEWSTVQEMTKIYPAIENALKNLQTTYALVKDDYEARKKN